LDSTLGFVSLAVSIVLYLLASASEKADREILGEIRKAIKEWEGRMMDASLKMLESRPEIIGAKQALDDTKAKHEVWQSISERIKYVVENPVSGNDSVAQQHMLQLLIDAVVEATKSREISPELYRLMSGIEAHPDKINAQQDQRKTD
jgi:hypothetical protein